VYDLQIGTYSMTLTPTGSQLLTSPGSSTSPTTISIQQMHADYPPALPTEGEWHLLASTPKCEVQGLVSFYPGEGDRKVHMFGWEGHPEVRPFSLSRVLFDRRWTWPLILWIGAQFTQSIVDKINRFRTDSGVFTREMSEEATRRAAEPHDGTGKIGEMMIRVLLGEL
jgi:hypothetical protein